MVCWMKDRDRNDVCKQLNFYGSVKNVQLRYSKCLGTYRILPGVPTSYFNCHTVTRPYLLSLRWADIQHFRVSWLVQYFPESGSHSADSWSRIDINIFTRASFTWSSPKSNLIIRIVFGKCPIFMQNLINPHWSTHAFSCGLLPTE